MQNNNLLWKSVFQNEPFLKPRLLLFKTVVVPSWVC